MKHIKSIILTLLTALLALPASIQAQDSNITRILYEQNFESVSNVEETGWTFGGQSMTLVSDAYGKFIEFSLGQSNGRSANLKWGKDIFFEKGNSEKSLLGDGKYKIEYEFCIKQGSNNQYNSSMTVYTNHTPPANQPYRDTWSPAGYWQNYLFDMSQVNGESLKYAINGGTIRTVNEDGSESYSINYNNPTALEEGSWYKVNLDVNVNDRTVDYSVKTMDQINVKQGQLVVPKTDVNGDSISMYAEGHHVMLARYMSVYCIDNIKIYTEISEDYANAPTIALVAIGYKSDWLLNLNARQYAVYFQEGETLHLVGTNGEQTDVEYDDCDGKWIYETDKSGYFRAWTTCGTASSEVVEEYAECNPITLPSAYVNITSVSDGFAKTYTLSVSNADVPLRPTIFINYEFIGINGEIINEEEVSSGVMLTVTQPGTLKITTEAWGYESNTVTVLNDREYGIKKEWDFARMTEDEIKNAGFPSFSVLNASATSGFNNWTGRKRLYYYLSGSEHVDDEGNVIYDVIYPFGFISEENTTNVIKYALIENESKEGEDAVRDEIFEGLTVFPKKKNTGHPNVGIMYHIGLYNDQTINNNNSIIVHDLDEEDIVVLNQITNYGSNSTHPFVSTDEEYYASLSGDNVSYKVEDYGVLNEQTNKYDVDCSLYRIDTACTKISVYKCLGIKSIESVLNPGDDFEYEGIWYTVLNTGKSLIDKADGSVMCDNLLSGGGGTGFEPCQIVSDVERGNVFMCEILPDPVNQWDSEFFIKSNEPLKAGDNINVSFMYKCSDERNILTQAHGEPGNYHHWDCIGTLNATTEWQHYSWSGTVNSEWVNNEGFISIAFLLSSTSAAATFYIDDVVFELERNTCKTKDQFYDQDHYALVSGNNCSGDLVIPGVAFYGQTEYAVTEIGNGSFKGNSLSSVSLPASLLVAGEEAFNHCSEISEVIYAASAPVAMVETMFPEDVYSNATLNTPNATLAAVQATVPWNKFRYIVANDGFSGFVESGEIFDFMDGMYEVIDAEEMVCRLVGHKAVDGSLSIPDRALYNSMEFLILGIGSKCFAGFSNLTSISLPSTIVGIDKDVFEGCEKLTSLIWRGNQQMPSNVYDAFANPNLLVYVDDVQYAPEGLDHNVVANGTCQKLMLTPGYPFIPVTDFTAKSSSLTKDFTQITGTDGCSGWETIVLPFDVTKVTSPQGHTLLPFNKVSDVNRQRPFWLYEADPTGEWTAADSIKAGVPYVISMPNNPRYNPAYNISGPVTFSNPKPQLITAETTAPYVSTWTSGREFRSLWVPLEDSEIATAMGLNVGIDNLTDDDGSILPPGSAFHTGVTPKPLEAYVVSNDNAKAFRIWGSQSAVLTLPDEDGLKIAQEGSLVILTSSIDRTIDIYSADATLLRRLQLKAGVPAYIDGLPQGVCLIAGRIIMIR